MMLDEIDKVGADWRGDPSSALLEVLDPAQNHTFRDHYLDVDLDLSEVLFIATGERRRDDPRPAARPDGGHPDRRLHRGREGRDRAAPPARRGSSSATGCAPTRSSLTDDALRAIVGDYTREAGVRNLEREIGKVLRKVATKIASGDATAPVTVDADDVRTYLGRPEVLLRGGRTDGGARRGDRPRRDRHRRRRPVHRGDARGRRPSKDGLTLTGQLGDVMKESAQIALSYVRSHAAELGHRPGEARAAGSTCTCPRARCRRTVRAPASP